MRYLLAGIMTLTLPFCALAASAGTDGYLREIGYTEEQLSTDVATEDREAFKMAEGAGRVEDPLGDVLGRWGTTSEVKQPWGDVERVILTKNDATQAWEATISFGALIPDKPTEKAQLFFYADTDGNKANNDREGIRVGTDAEFSIQYNQEHGWYTDFRWYNPDADFWAMNKETMMTFEVGEDSVTLSIPFSEFTGDQEPHWRVAMGLSSGDSTQIDVAPGIGFPPPKGETYPEAPAVLVPDWLNKAGWAVVGIVVGYGAYQTLAKKRKDG